MLLSHYPGLTLKMFKKLTEFFCDAKDRTSFTEQNLKRAKVSDKKIQSFLKYQKEFNPERAKKILEQNNITTVYYGESNYPSSLYDLYDPPAVLFVRGNIKILSEKSISIVGARNCSTYGEEETTRLVVDAVKRSLVIVSGLALGIDGEAHRKTLNCGGKTAAILGSGINDKSISPSSHYALAMRILENNGCLVSEFPPGTRATVYTFPKRNRIIAALGIATIVMEARKKSGALITAECALEIGRDLFALPHDVYRPTGKGCNKIISEGAHPLVDLDYLWDTLNINLCETNETKEVLSEKEDSLVKLLVETPLSIDDLVEKTSLDVSEILQIISTLEIKGIISENDEEYHLVDS